jgi:GxxExxY protein
MPIIVEADLRLSTQAEFAAIAYEVMQVVFAVHNELGRFLDEELYQREIAKRLPMARLEVPIRVLFEGFSKIYFVDLLVEGAAPFELKAVANLTGRHRAQLINYLLLTELRHGKLVNLRPDTVQHRFVNSTLNRADRLAFEIESATWDNSKARPRELLGWLTSALSDWGTGLELRLYEEACTYFLGGDDKVLGETEIIVGGQRLGAQQVRLVEPNAAFKVTALEGDARATFEDHARRFLAHSSLDAIHWINITIRHVRFATIRRTQPHAELDRAAFTAMERQKD